MVFAGRLYISDEKLAFVHPHSAAVVLPLSCLDSLLFYDGVRCHKTLRTSCAAMSVHLSPVSF